MKREYLIHVLCWAVIILFPLFFVSPNDGSELMRDRFIRSLGSPVACMALFYLNYAVLIPRLYFKDKRVSFYLTNLLLVVLALVFMHQWWHLANSLLPGVSERPHRRPPGAINPMYFYNTIMLMLVVGLSIAVRMTGRYHDAEQARREAVQRRTEAELTNLRNQLNPHFLLNTLNNIYALIAFDTVKAQVAVEELSRLLRHVLYDNSQPFVPLCKEAAFMRDYVALMKIRLTSAVTLEEHIDIDDKDMTPIAPLIFISLVENAFKHGISASGNGFISITVKRDGDNVICDIKNSNHPKDKQGDKSGSGIGLEQVAKRLELMYPDRFNWVKGVSDDGATYYSTITIQTT